MKGVRSRYSGTLSDLADMSIGLKVEAIGHPVGTGIVVELKLVTRQAG
jgi:hypothetical protein